MRILARRLIVIGVIALSGGAAGVALGDFVVRPGPSRLPGVAAAVEVPPGFDDPLDPVAVVRSDRPAPAGPSSYHCEGCDARLHDGMVAGDAAFADVAPLPPYRPEEGAVPERPVRQAAGTGPHVQVPGIMLPGIETGAQKATPVTVDGPRPEGRR